MVSDKDAKKLIGKQLPKLLLELGISHWDIQVDLEELEPGIIGDCSPRVKYESALIRIDPSQHHDEADIMATLVHECLHILHSPFDVAADAIRRVLQGQAAEGQDSPALLLFEELWSVSEELTVKNLERSYLNLKKPR